MVLRSQPAKARQGKWLEERRREEEGVEWRWVKRRWERRNVRTEGRGGKKGKGKMRQADTEKAKKKKKERNYSWEGERRD